MPSKPFLWERTPFYSAAPISGVWPWAANRVYDEVVLNFLADLDLSLALTGMEGLIICHHADHDACTGYIRHPFQESLFDNDSYNIQMPFVRRDVPYSLYNHISSQIPTECFTVLAPLPREETVRPL